MGHHPTTPPYNFKGNTLSMKEGSGKKALILKMAQNDPLTHPSQKIDQVDSKIKDMGYSKMFKKKFIDQP